MTGRETGGEEEGGGQAGIEASFPNLSHTWATGDGPRHKGGKKMDGHFLRRGSVGRRKKGDGQSCASVASLRASEEVGVGSQKEEGEGGR